MKQAILICILAASAAMAGCATNDDAEGATVDTPTTTTPVATPEPTPPATPDAPETETPTPAPPQCAQPEPSTAPLGEKLGYPEVVVTVAEPTEEDPCYHFVAPATVEEGWTAITLRNNGMKPHIMPMFRIAEGHTYEELLGALAAGGQPDWVTPVGGVGFATPFASGTVLMDLEPATYVLICFFEGHHMQGMYWPLEVTASEAGAAREGPVASFTVTLDDYAYDVPENLTAGAHVMRVHNVGAEPHEAPLVKLNENTTMEQFLAAIENPQGPPPGQGIGGVNVLAPGADAYAVVDLEPGNYGFVCFVESEAHEGKPHVALGMSTQFSVAPAAATA